MRSQHRPLRGMLAWLLIAGALVARGVRVEGKAPGAPREAPAGGGAPDARGPAPGGTLPLPRLRSACGGYPARCRSRQSAPPPPPRRGPRSEPEGGGTTAVAHPSVSSMGIAGFVDIHYDNRERSRFTIIASRYRMSVALDHPRVTALRLGDEAAPNLLEGDAITFEARRRAGAVY